MTTRRIITLIIAVLVAFLIAYAGKSCAEDIAETNRQNRLKNDTTYGTQGNTPGLIEDTPQYNNNSQNVTTDPNPELLEPTEYVETVTNIFGDVIGTVPPAESSTQAPDSGSIFNQPDNTSEEPTSPPPILDRNPPVQAETQPATADLNDLILHIN